MSRSGIGLDPWPERRPDYVVVEQTPAGIYAVGFNLSAGAPPMSRPPSVPLNTQRVRLIRLACGHERGNSLPDVIVGPEGNPVSVAALQELKEVPF